MITSCVYTLIDPRTNKIRYIGQSINPEQRYKQHLSCDDGSPRVHWIQELRAQGVHPKMVILESGLSVHDAPEAEMRWIRRAHSLGHQLTNVIDERDHRKRIMIRPTPELVSALLAEAKRRNEWDIRKVAADLVYERLVELIAERTMPISTVRIAQALAQRDAKAGHDG